jgi:hypothetical protein
MDDAPVKPRLLVGGALAIDENSHCGADQTVGVDLRQAVTSQRD